MLSHLHISNFTLVDRLDLELHSGLSVLTGETGAGKSILLDALSLILGGRADASKVRKHTERSDIQATFRLNNLPNALKWLNEHELNSGSECILRRTVTQEGRSRAYINGQTVTLSQLKQLGALLINIHGQHEHHSLLKPATHQHLLDEFGQHVELAQKVQHAYTEWRTTRLSIEALQNKSDEINAQFQLLNYQVEELDVLAVQEDEVTELEAQQKQLANIETLKQHCQHVDTICNHDEHGLTSQLYTAIQLLKELEGSSTQLTNATHLLQQALIHVQEAHDDIERELQDDTLDPRHLPEIEQRLSAIYDVARKHRIHHDALPVFHQQLREKLNAMQSGDLQLETLENTLKAQHKSYQFVAKKLSTARKTSANILAKAINHKLKQLNMSHATFAIDLNTHAEEQPHIKGYEDTRFLISTTPSSSPQALAKIASGGELSRISLAIQVVTAQTSDTPTLMFDEVDVGIGGTTGDIVGLLLRELSENSQVFCVTHLAQVATKAHNHLYVEKTIGDDTVNSSVLHLDTTHRIKEIARMMGGSIDSAQSLAHAQEMLKSSTDSFSLQNSDTNSLH